MTPKVTVHWSTAGVAIGAAIVLLLLYHVITSGSRNAGNKRR